jgi:homoserine trans-succinylase
MLYTTLFFGYAASTGKFINMRGGDQMHISTHVVLKAEVVGNPSKQEARSTVEDCLKTFFPILNNVADKRFDGDLFKGPAGELLENEMTGYCKSITENSEWDDFALDSSTKKNHAELLVALHTMLKERETKWQEALEPMRKEIETKWQKLSLETMRKERNTKWQEALKTMRKEIEKLETMLKEKEKAWTMPLEKETKLNTELGQIVKLHHLAYKPVY